MPFFLACAHQNMADGGGQNLALYNRKDWENLENGELCVVGAILNILIIIK